MRQEIIRLDAGVLSAASVVGYLEHDGPIGPCFDFYDDKKNGGDRFGQDTFERAESEMQRIALNGALAKCGMPPDRLDALFAGDLLNQCTSSAYGLLDFDVPYFGLYGACSTAAEGLLLWVCWSHTPYSIPAPPLLPATTAPPSGSIVPRWNTVVSVRPRLNGR